MTVAAGAPSLDFAALVGDPRHREIVIPDFTARGDRVVWLDERSGTERARRTLGRHRRAGQHRDAGVRGALLLPLRRRAGLWELRPAGARAGLTALGERLDLREPALRSRVVATFTSGATPGIREAIRIR